MRIPNRIMEHPVEALVAGALLLALLFGSSDLQARKGAAARAGAAQQMGTR